MAMFIIRFIHIKVDFCLFHFFLELEICVFSMVIKKIQQLSMSQIANLHVPLSDEEERLVASIPSHVSELNIETVVQERLSFRLFQFHSMMNLIDV